MGQKSTAVMSLQEAHSHALRQATLLRAFEQIEEVLKLAMGAETVQKEAEKARSKAVDQKEVLERAIQKLTRAHDDLALSIKGKAVTAHDEALKVEVKAKSDHVALVKVQKEDLAAKLLEGANKIDHLHTQIVTRTVELAALDTKVTAANEALEALRKGLAGPGQIA